MSDGPLEAAYKLKSCSAGSTLMKVIIKGDKLRQTVEYDEQWEDRRQKKILFMTTSEEEAKEGVRAERTDEIIGGRGVIVASKRVYHPERDQVLQ